MKNFMPLRVNVFRRRAATSLSSTGRHSFIYSITVTSLPKDEKIDANSIPMTPAPIIHRRCGMRSVASSSSDVMTAFLSNDGMFGIFGTAPVAMMMLSAVYSSLPTTTVLLSLKLPLPCTNVIPGCDIRNSTPLRNCSMTVF